MTFRTGHMFTCKNSRRAFLITVENKAEFVEMARQIAKKRLATSRAAKVKAGPKQPPTVPPKHLQLAKSKAMPRKAGPKQPPAPPPKHLLERRALEEECP